MKAAMAADVIFWVSEQGAAAASCPSYSVAREDLPTEKVIGKQSGLNPL